MFTKVIRSSHFSLKRSFINPPTRIPGTSKIVEDTRQVALRGTFIKGNYEDLPNLIFFPELCDPATNWTEFFLDPSNNFLNYRNVWLLDPRNFGDSDQHPSFDLSEMAEDVMRFMYFHRISTATLAGHGFGAKLATATACYFPERVTGVVGIDGGPLDHRFHEPYHELREILEKLTQVNQKGTRNEVEIAVRTAINDPKWKRVFAQNLKKVSENKFGWNFNLEYLLHNMRFNKADSVGNWTEKHGIYGGRSMFIFPEYSRWIHLNTNTLPLHRVCVHLEGYGKDIFSLQGDENPLNHWMYELDEYAFPLSRKFVKFLTHYDGVHTLLKNRDEIGNYFIPDLPYSRRDPDHIYRDYSPAHLHHNWRFSTIYEDAENFEKENADAQADVKEESAKKNK